MPKKKQARKFNYAVGYYWEGESGSIGTYNYFGEVHCGTMEEAKSFREYCQSRLDNKGKNKRNYKIFQLVEIPE